MIVMKNKQPTLPLDQPAQQHPGATLQKKKGVGALVEAPLSACTCDTETQTRLDTTVLRQRRRSRPEQVRTQHGAGMDFTQIISYRRGHHRVRIAFIFYA